MLALSVLDWLYALVWQVRSLAPHRRRPRAGRQDGPAAGSGPARGVEVLVLPGVYESWRFLRPLIAAVRGAGHRVHVVPGLRLNAAEVPATSALVGQHVAATGLGAARPLVVLAHSKGGLVGKHLMVHHDPERRVAAMVSVNSPFSGSSRARWLPFAAVRVFVPGGQVLTDLAAARGVDTRITSIYSAVDPNIPGTSHLDGATNVEIDAVGHFRVLADPRFHAAVLEALDRSVG